MIGDDESLLQPALDDEVQDGSSSNLRRILSLGAPVLVVALVAWGSAALGAPQLLSGLPEPTPISLDEPLPRATDAAVLTVSGTTRPFAFVRGYVDIGPVQLAFAEPSGRFSLALPLATLGTHTVRIEVTYGSPDDPPSERTSARVTRTPTVLSPPGLVDVERDEARDAYLVLLSTTPGTSIRASEGRLEAVSGARELEWGRAVYRIWLPDPAPDVRFIAVRDGGGESPPSPPFDLAALIDATPKADWTDVAISYAIDRHGVSRTLTVSLEPERIELTELTEGRLDALAFLEVVAGRSGLAPVPRRGCLVGRYGSGPPDIVIADRATVTFRDDFPDFVTASNGFADRPRVSLCFPDGVPILGNTGRLEVTVADYAVASTNPRPDSISVEQPEGGSAQRVYGWSVVRAGGSIELVLAVDVQTSLGLIPKARLGNLFPDSDVGPLVSGLFYALVQAASLVLLLWVTASALGRRYFPAPAGPAGAHVLTLGISLAFVPVVAQVTGVLSYPVFDALRSPLAGFDAWASDLRVEPDEIGGWVLGFGMLVVFGGMAVGLRRVGQPLPARLGTALAASSFVWLMVSVVGRFAINAAGDAGVPAQSIPPLAAWVIGSGLLFVVLSVSWRWFSRLGVGVANPSAGRLVAIAGWVAVAALILAFPAGRQLPDPGAVGGPAALLDSVSQGMIALLAYGYALIGVAAVAGVVRAVWRATPWEAVVGFGRSDRAADAATGPRGPERLLVRVGRVVFAGNVIGTAGVFAVLPVPFLVALPLFDRLLLRPRPEVLALAEAAPIIRTDRRRLLEESIRRGTTPEPKDAPWTPPDAGYVRSEEFMVRNVAAVGPAASVWGNVVLGLSVAGLLVIGLVALYLTQYSFTSVTSDDPHYLQRLGLNIAAFVGSWLIVAFLFGLMFEYLRGESGLQKGLWLGASILLLTLPFQLLSTLASGLPLISITIRVLQVLAFTVLLGAAFDLHLLRQQGRLQFGRPRTLLRDLGGMSGTTQVTTGVLFIVGSIVGTVGTIVTGQLTQILTRILTPFLPLPVQ